MRLRTYHEPRDLSMYGIVLATVTLVAVAVCAHDSYAAEYDRADTFAAMEQASADTGVPYSTLYNIIGCETGWTFNPNIEGDGGHSHGVAQINDYGNARPVFYGAAGYTNPYNPYESTYFMAEVLRGDHRPLGRHTWSC